MSVQKNKSIRNLFVLDTEAPWIRSLLRAMPSDVNIHGFRARNAFSFPGGLRAQLQKVGKSERITDTWVDTWISIPGWHKAFSISSWLVTKQVKNVLKHYGMPDAFLFTLPWYAKVADNFYGMKKAYYAHDTFRYYSWDCNKVIRLERRLLYSCSVGFGVARQVVKDLEALSPTPVQYLPMATGWRQADPITAGVVESVNDFKSIPVPRVGCVGQINSTSYNWDLIKHLSHECPNFHFVFIGPRFSESSKSVADKIDAIFNKPNIHWLGPKFHDHLPAYLQQCQVLINPLLVNGHNNRRCLLRLYDYLTTDLPIVSTAIMEAYNHLPHIHVATDPNEFSQMLQAAISGVTNSNLEQRRSYIAKNTWKQRADVLCSYLF